MAKEQTPPRDHLKPPANQDYAGLPEAVITRIEQKVSTKSSRTKTPDIVRNELVYKATQRREKAAAFCAWLSEDEICDLTERAIDMTVGDFNNELLFLSRMRNQKVEMDARRVKEIAEVKEETVSSSQQMMLEMFAKQQAFMERLSSRIDQLVIGHEPQDIDVDVDDDDKKGD